MDLEVIVSTMNLIDQENLIKKMNIKISSLIINQTKEDVNKLEDISYSNNKLINCYEKGLSNSRNTAIMNSKADICIVADDDLTYIDNFDKVIIDAYDKYTDADVIAFYVENEDLSRQKKKMKESKVDFFKSMKIQSVQLTFKRESILKNGISFNQKFGAGSELYMGEENIFLCDCLKSKLKIYYVPNKIAKLNKSESSWFEGYTDKYFKIRGCIYYEMSRFFYPLFITQFAIRKYKLYKKDNTLISAFYNMFQGLKEYNIKKTKIYMLGDFHSYTGPSIVNKNYLLHIKNNVRICKAKNKIVRIFDVISGVYGTKTLLISGVSKLHAYACLLSKLLNKRVVYLMHGYNAMEYKINSKEVNSKQKKYINYESMILKKSNKIICVSEKFSQLLKDERSDLKNKIDYVNNGIDNKFDIIKKVKKDSCYRIITVGGAKLKRIESIFKAIKGLQNNCDIRFIVIGKINPEYEYIKNCKFVEYYENLPHDDVLRLMSISDLYIQNSEFETFGLAIFESIKEGCDVLVSNNVGALSIIQTLNENYIIYDCYDENEIVNKIKYVMHNPNRNLLCEMLKYKHFSFEYAAQNLLDKLNK